MGGRPSRVIGGGNDSRHHVKARVNAVDHARLGMQNNEFCFSIEATDAAKPCCYSGDIAHGRMNEKTVWRHSSVERAHTPAVCGGKRAIGVSKARGYVAACQ